MSFLKRIFGIPKEISYIRIDRQPNGYTYEVFQAHSRSHAMSFLRNYVVKKPSLYAIVETPEGNIGKDFIMLFDEASEDMIEFGERKKLKRLTKKKGHCCCCGYPVLSVGSSPSNLVAENSFRSVRQFISTQQLKEKGAGFVCPNCSRACCAICASPEEDPACPHCGSLLVLY